MKRVLSPVLSIVLLVLPAIVLGQGAPADAKKAAEAPANPPAAATGWSLKSIKASDLTSSTVNGAAISGVAQGSGSDVVITYTAGAQYGIHQVEYVDKLAAADFAGKNGIRVTVTSPNFGRLIVILRDYQGPNRAYEGTADISFNDKRTYDIPFSSMKSPGWATGNGHDDAAASVKASEVLDTLTIGWVCNTAGLAGTVTIHNVELY